MNGKEKLKNALSHIEGPVPVDFGGAGVTGMHCSIVEKLRERLGLEKRPVVVSEPYQMLGEIDRDLREALNIDIAGIYTMYDIFGLKHDGKTKEWITPWGQNVLMPGNFEFSNDEKGSVLIYPRGNRNTRPSAIMPKSGKFFDSIIRQEEIDDQSLNAKDNLEEFVEYDPESLDYISKKVEEARTSNSGVIGTPGGTALGDIALVPGPGLENPKGIRDVEEWYISMVARRDYLSELFDRQTDIAIANLKKYFDVAGNDVDAVLICGTDFGTQQSAFCSIQTLRELYVPYYRKMNDWIHRNTEWKVFKHCCGAVEPFIGELYDCGFDIINPVQWTAKGMDRAELKKKYGDRVVFWGGGVDTQKTLPFGTPGQVYDEVLECLKIFGKNGGFVFSSIHNIQAKTPIDNIIAMFNAVYKYNGISKIL